MARYFGLFIVGLAAMCAAATPGLAAPKKTDAKFFSKIDGRWKGPGEIVAGKYKGTRFVCDLEGTTPSNAMGMTLDGSCRVGMFSQEMKAEVKVESNSYSGSFLDGADGEGLDVIGGNVSADRVVFTIKRKKLNGAMLARLASENQMNVTISVRVGEELVPVVGMKLSRIDGTAVGSIR
ncbi:MAG: hypothetical protein AAGI92_04175 [Pseudomonadota bacterium]